ncbi:NACHT domain-containing protein [Desulfovibrio sp. OttesenSCG-928-A18]|nr:NACHT domain-containing protein [Desulfovibrio sp. OttesenSCG-928-A18]
MQSCSIEFKNILEFHGRKDKAFEELVCQLAAITPPDSGASYRRIEGAGGDGGIESCWVKTDGSLVGIQAKYFLKSGDINWEQVDASVQQALTTYPNLAEYVIAFACDLTGKKGKKQKGKSGWEQWDEHCKKWASWASPRTVVFTLWAQSTLVGFLSKPEAVGMKAFWFGEFELTSAKIAAWVSETKSMLGERYHPEDHIDVQAQRAAYGVMRHSKTVAKLQDLFTRLPRMPLFPQSVHIDSLKLPDLALQEKASEYHNYLSSIDLGQIGIDKDWETYKWIDATERLLDIVQMSSNWCVYAKSIYNNSEQQNKYPYAAYSSALIKIWDYLEELTFALKSKEILAERTKNILITGTAGSGKSHLLAHIVQEAIDELHPVLFLLGQQFTAGRSPWSQICERLGHPNLNPEVLLATLDSAAQAEKKRALIVIDALNEGAGGMLWRNELASFISKISNFSHIACIMSCRSEYIRHVIPRELASTILTTEVMGFVTQEEKEAAAQVYLDGKGILRPSTPWLFPEFTNPLFLRTATTAIQKEGKREFPSGLHGISSLYVYHIESTARFLSDHYAGTDALVKPTKKALRELAKSMASQKKDFVVRTDAERIINDAFSSNKHPDNLTWTELMEKNGVIRLDPPYTVPSDPMACIEEEVRFSLQRFQDHEMALFYLSGASDVGKLFLPGGELHFLAVDPRQRDQWAGLITSLSTILPELHDLELVDILPDDVENWIYDRTFSEAFAESLRWRDKAAFSDRTIDILNDLEDAGINTISLMIELSTREGHPLNAELLHTVLSRGTMPERDAWWSQSIATATHYEEHPIHGLIEWSMHLPISHSPSESHYLAAVSLSWIFSTSSRPIRDKATKALVELLLFDYTIFDRLAEKFASVDDFYILERIYAAAYGSACIDPNKDRLRTYCNTVIKYIFSSEYPPLHIRLRDYTLGIIELAATAGLLPPSRCLSEFTPPYKSSPPDLTLKKEGVEYIAKESGDPAILYSCKGWAGDFGRYEIPPAIGRFINIPIGVERPTTRDEEYGQYLNQVLANIESRRLYKKLQDLNNAILRRDISIRHAPPDDSGLFRIVISSSLKRCAERDEVKRLLKKLYTAIGEENKEFFKMKIAPRLFGKHEVWDFPRFSDEQACLWVAERAYSYGWNSQLFPRDSSESRGRERPTVERIGKKYQWLALNELMARLADNFWLYEKYTDDATPYIYKHLLELGLERDIDPTINWNNYPSDNKLASSLRSQMEYEITLDDCEEDKLPEWPTLEDPTQTFYKLITKRFEGQDWVVLSDHKSFTEKYLQEDGIRREHLNRREEFYIIHNLMIEKNKRRQFAAHLDAKQTIDAEDFFPPRTTDEGFLFEPRTRSGWSNKGYVKSFWRDESMQHISWRSPLVEYHWENHLDLGLPEHTGKTLPSALLIETLGLSPASRDCNEFLTPSGELAYIYHESTPGLGCAMIRADLYEQFLIERDLSHMWVFIAERSSWAKNRGFSGDYTRFESVAWYEGKTLRHKSWNRSNRSGEDEQHKIQLEQAQQWQDAVDKLTTQNNKKN